MNGNEMLDLLGDVKGTYVMEAQKHREEKKKTKRHSPFKIVLIAAAITSLLAGCTYAVMRLQDLKIGEYTVTHQVSVASTEGEAVEKPEVTEVKNAISLQGFVGSTGYQASKEWYDFKNSYDQDMELLVANDDFQAPRVYDGYGVYTQEMMDKVDEICQKYSLVPMGRCFAETTNVPAALELLGVNGLLVQNAEAKLERMQGYYYEQGTFSIEGDVTLTNVDTPLVETLSFGIRCAMKHAMDVVPASMGNAEDYTQWNYTTKNGVEVLLATTKVGSVIVADRPDCFIYMNFHRGYTEDNTLTQEQLEALADAFDFTIRPHTVSVEDGMAREKKSNEEWDENQQKIVEDARAWHNARYRKNSYTEFVEDCLNDPKRKNAKFVLKDVTGDGNDELLILNEEIDKMFGHFTMTYVLTMQEDGKTNCVLQGTYQMFEGNVFGTPDPYDPEKEHPYQTFEYMRLNGAGGFDDNSGRVDYTYLSYTGERWSKNENPMGHDYVEITESEAMEIINSHTPVEIDWKPITEFPMD